MQKYIPGFRSPLAAVQGRSRFSWPHDYCGRGHMSRREFIRYGTSVAQSTQRWPVRLNRPDVFRFLFGYIERSSRSRGVSVSRARNIVTFTPESVTITRHKHTYVIGSRSDFEGVIAHIRNDRPVTGWCPVGGPSSAGAW